ncbi:hypothetical protein HDA41_006615 [Streptomyces caelestis]|uniref:Uncharacterized protein n=1 Tax=Streptomyces caelestis TaxID=36816 RepID=A0A7W9HAZ9_9ACTN|nr:hypothetical protein [Streptomyces caelestis]
MNPELSAVMRQVFPPHGEVGLGGGGFEEARV